MHILIVDYLDLKTEFINNLYYIDELIASLKNFARFIFHTNNAIFLPIP